jgi:syntaxin-binding protein 5
MAYGNESGLAIVDIVQKVCLFNVASPDLYGAQDPYSRVPRSPKRSEPPYSTRDEQRSPSIDQVSVSCVELFLMRHLATTCCVQY